MIWSDEMTPFLRPAATPSTAPTPWTLQELHAQGGEIFRTPAGDVVPTDEERAAELQSEREQAAAEGYEAGYRAGVAEAQASADARMGSAITALDAALARVQEEQSQYLDLLEENLAALAVCVARQIIAREVRTAPEVTVDLIRKAIAEFPIDEALRIRVNPMDLSAMTLAREGDAARMTPRPDIAWVPDPRVACGGCVIEGRERIVDGRVDVALERAYRRLSNSAA